VNGDPLDATARLVLGNYPHLTGCPLQPLGNSAGFSRAHLWRLDSMAGPAYLRAWPIGEDAARLVWIHHLMETAHLAGLLFVPVISRTTTGSSVIEQGDRCWEVGTWLPGVADYHAHPSPVRLGNTCRALAGLHRAWSGGTTAPVAPIPALERRWQALREVSGVRAESGAGPIAWQASALLERWLPAVAGWLERWARRALPLQPCLTDVWHDHILFTRERVTGIVDYGGVQVDHPTADLARLLGSLVEDDTAAWTVGLTAYAEVAQLPQDALELARDLDRSATVLSLGRWLQRPDLAEARAERRLAELVQRVERWGPA
jgi:hypothetical protein